MRVLLIVVAMGWATAAIACGAIVLEPQDTRGGNESRPEWRSEGLRAATEGLVVLVIDEKTRKPVPGARVTRFESGLKPIGNELVADQDGRVQIPAGMVTPVIGARDGDRFAYCIVGRPAPGRLKIVIGPDVSCRVRVVDQAAQGVAGIRVDLLTGAAAELASGVTDTSGMVDLRSPMETQGVLRGMSGGLGLLCRIHVRGPGLPRHTYPATPAADGVIPVVLPPFGWLSVSTKTPEGESLRSTTDVETSAEHAKANAAGVGYSNRVVTASGTSTWPVGLSKTYVVTAGVPELKWHASSTVEGPKAAGEKTIVPFVVSVQGPVLVGRLVDQDGEPLREFVPEAHFILMARDGGAAHGFDDFGTDARGRFRVLVEQRGPLPGAGPWRRIQLVMGDRTDVGTREEMELAATRPVRRARVEVPLNLTTGDHELGDVVFKLPPLVASGVVLDQSGRPVPEASVRLALRVREDMLGWVSTRARADGSFELRGFVDADSIALEAEREDFTTSETPTIPRGAKDVRVILRKE